MTHAALFFFVDSPVVFLAESSRQMHLSLRRREGPFDKENDWPVWSEMRLLVYSYVIYITKLTTSVWCSFYFSYFYISTSASQ
jgi:hypothetical protein